MFIRITPVIAVTLLSGCSLMKVEQNHQQTLSTLQNIDTNLSAQIDSLNLHLEQQSAQIVTLEEKLIQLQERSFQLQETTLTKIEDYQSTPPAPVVMASPAPAPTNPVHGVTLGEIEQVTIDSIKQTFDARVDTGAATSSLNAVDIEQFERNGKKWVRFHLSDEQTPMDDNNWIEAPVLKFVKIRQSTNEEVERRAVVELWVKVGKIHEKAQFTLADRSQMSHPVLLGREFIKDIAVVDVSKKYVQSEEK
ncbi:ATP-dependent zinc protease [Vibrio renipiscarius]|uniref:ATP-dependent Zn protease n=1 Tax=Vibrio renipiscarius TaxID=1461322 RepID=A0A0C2NBT1_9VIBR|nr:ATP-dependent zinc protease [Vibrio renipiscarius]KII77081.1 ATP-dependent Zn protease [Vibrio renipiscarius]KII77211.1 ATP-dependent Zn protease [Vibrio renipiscarius]